MRGSLQHGLDVTYCDAAKAVFEKLTTIALFSYVLPDFFEKKWVDT